MLTDLHSDLILSLEKVKVVQQELREALRQFVAQYFSHCEAGQTFALVDGAEILTTFRCDDIDNDVCVSSEVAIVFDVAIDKTTKILPLSDLAQ